MPNESPIQKPPASKNSGAVNSIVRAERLMQIAFILPAAVVVGWLAGAGLDKWLHQHWIYLRWHHSGLRRRIRSDLPSGPDQREADEKDGE